MTFVSESLQRSDYLRLMRLSPGWKLTVGQTKAVKKNLDDF